MGGALGVVLTTNVPIEGRAAIPVYVDDSLPIVGPSRAVVVMPVDGSARLAGGAAIPVRLAPAGTPAIGPALPVYVVSGSLSTAASFDPSQIAGLFLWLDASKITGLADGAAVGSWTDASGNGHTATATGNARPTYKTNIVGGRPVVRFDGSNDTLVTAAYAANLAQPCTYVVVEQHTTTAANLYAFDGIDTTNRQALFTKAAPAGWNFFAGSTQPRTINPGVFRVHVVTFTTSDTLYIDDCLVGLGDAGAGASAGLTLGGRWNALAGAFLPCDIADVLIYNRAITPAERRQLTRYYLITKYALLIDPNTARGAANAATFLTTPTYDGSNQAIHPDIYYNAATWNGKKYWMSCTPYPNNSAALENPSILVSDDGQTWAVPAGGSNPVIAAPVAPAFNSDPCLLHVASDNKLYLYYRTSDGVANTDIISVVSSADGTTWSAPAAMVSGLYRRVVAPSVVFNGSVFTMFYLDTAVTPYQLLKRTCATPNGVWSASSISYLDPPAGQDLWHLTMFWDAASSRYHALVATVPSGSTGGTPGYLWFAVSQDGETWLLADSPLLSPGAAGAWDSYEIYRSGAVRTATGYDVWYSARSDQASPTVWHTGFTTVTL